MKAWIAVVGTVLSIVASPVGASTVLNKHVGKTKGGVAITETTTPYTGVFQFPDDGKAHPAILLLHGSEGGGVDGLRTEAHKFAELGYASLALCWFACKTYDPTVPDSLEEVNLERTYKAFAWLANSKYAKGHSTGIYGVSRGGEQVVLLAAYIAQYHPELPAPDVVAAHAPFAHILHPFTSNYLTGYSYNWGGSHEGLQSDRRSEIERYKGPMFFSHGTIDPLSNPKAESDILNAIESTGRRPSVTEYPQPTCSVTPVAPIPSVQAGDGEEEIHFFDCEKHIFKKDKETFRMGLLEKFLKKHLK